VCLCVCSCMGGWGVGWLPWVRQAPVTLASRVSSRLSLALSSRKGTILPHSFSTASAWRAPSCQRVASAFARAALFFSSCAVSAWTCRCKPGYSRRHWLAFLFRRRFWACSCLCVNASWMHWCVGVCGWLGASISLSYAAPCSNAPSPDSPLLQELA
jgi:hypothetical protein